MVAEDTPQAAASRRLGWLALGLWLAMAVVAAAALWHLRSQALESQARELDLLSLALTDEIDRGLRGVEEGLDVVRAEIREGRLPLAQSDDATTRALRIRADLMPLVRTLWRVRADGRVVAASDAMPAPALSGFSPPLDRLAPDATSISRPFDDAVSQQTLVAMAVRLHDAPGIDGGWLLAAMPASTLLGAFSAALPAPDARMAVYRSDGVQLAGAQLDAPMRDEAGPAQRLAGSGRIELRRSPDGSETLVGRHPVARYDIDVAVSRDLSALLGPWRGAAELAGTVLLLLAACMAAAVHLIQRADRRRTEAQRALQAQRARAGKLESLGTLAGSVAHDFNNVLAGIVGFGEMAQDAALPGSDQARHLDKLLGAALRGKALVERILAFSRGGARASTVFELAPVVDEVLNLLSASLPSGTVIERALDARDSKLRGDPTQAFEAVMNLCTNALQAMPDGGVLHVQLERLRVTVPRVLSHSPLPAGDWLALTITDQGSGITPEVMEHLFEPFFTTRAARAGTGLGLAVVHGVVAEFRGAIDVTSRPGQGARFALYLPECTDLPGAAAVAQPAAAPAGAGQRLLVVDDEPELVALAQEMLQGLGYEVVGCSDASSALRTLRDAPQRFAAVITDEVMPGLSGTQLTQALREHAPNLPVLLVSGYGGALLAQRAAAAGVSRLLAKPLRRADLAQVLADVLR